MERLMSLPPGFETRYVSRAALLGHDYRGVNFELLCEPGDEVKSGAAVMRDLRRPEIRFSAPVSGRISRIERGARRKLISLQIDVDDSLAATRFAPPASNDGVAIRSFMLESGAWSILRTRPFGNIPDPDGNPAAVFVTALDAEPLAPDTRTIIDNYMLEFRAAVIALAGISDAPLYVCHAPDHALEFEDSSRVRCVTFNGGYSAGLPGVHINALCPIGFAGGEVWHIGYQDVIALGHLLVHGEPWLQRIISLGGNAVRSPRSLAVYPGSAISELLANEVNDGPSQILSGSSVYGRKLSTGSAYLGATQRQVTVLGAAAGDSGDKTAATSNAVIPGESLEKLILPGIFPVPLMRALQLGDAERARELGALELVEEDVMPLSRACVSNNDYAVLLRDALDQLEAVR
jgi:Na+-transporting NADH:ubiquinone oxidoreductase subunit A